MARDLPGSVDPDVARRASEVELILLDVDGVLTDGRVYVDAHGDGTRVYDIKDGHGIRMGIQAGIRFGIVTGRSSDAVSLRARSLGVTEVHQGAIDKAPVFADILERLGLEPRAACFVGDDLIDLPVMSRCGLAVAVADAVPEVLEAAHLVTRRPGGRGAVREVVDLVLRASGKWNDVTGRYFS